MLVAMFPGRAAAHAELQSADPEPQSVLEEAPETVTLRLTEPAALESRIVVEDGCERDVSGDRSIAGRAVEIATDDPQPGRWKVGYRLISAVDGHVVEGDYRLRVRGEPECPGNDEGSHDEEAAPPPIPDEDGGLPILPVAIGSIVLVGIALLVRLLGSR